MLTAAPLSEVLDDRLKLGIQDGDIGPKVGTVGFLLPRRQHRHQGLSSVCSIGSLIS